MCLVHVGVVSMLLPKRESRRHSYIQGRFVQIEDGKDVGAIPDRARVTVDCILFWTCQASDLLIRLGTITASMHTLPWRVLA